MDKWTEERDAVIQWLKKMLLLNILLVPIMLFMPVVCVPLLRSPEGATAWFFVAPLSAGFYVLVYSQWSSAMVWQRAGRLKQWRTDHGGFFRTVPRACGWLFGAIFFSYVAEAGFLLAFRRVFLLPLATRVTTAQDEGLRRHPDENHAAYPLKHGFVLLTCDRDYLDESRFPLVHCPAIVVFNFGSGSLHEIRQSFACLTTMLGIPQFYDKWVKIDAKPDCWTEYARYLNGTTSRTRYRVHRSQLQE